MQQKFNSEAAQGMRGVYLFKIEGEGDYFLKINDGNLQVSQESVDEPNVTFKADKGTWESIAAGQMPAQMAFMMGKLSVTGDLPLALKLASVFSLN